MHKGFKESFRYFYFQFDREHGKYANESRYKLAASAWRYNNKRKPPDKKWHLMYNLLYRMERNNESN